jgi:L-malate glycosyltransferase
MINILHIALDFNLNSGVTTYVTMLLRHFSARPEYKVSFITNGGSALQRLDSVPVKPVIIPMQTGIRNILNVNANAQLIKGFCAENEINIIHSHHRYPEFIAHRVSKGLNLRTITTAHSMVKGFKALSFKSDRIIAVSNAVKERIIEDFGVDRSKIIMFYNCVEEIEARRPEENKALRKELGIPENNKVILYIGRFDDIKGVPYLIHAFDKICNEFQAATLLLIGDVDRSFQKYSNKRIKILPPQENSAQYYRISDIVVLPAKRDPFPYVMLETGLASKPFIGSRVDGIAEFIEDGKDGLLFPAKDEEALAAAMLRVLRDDDLASQLATNLHHKVKSLPTCEQYCERLDKIYREMLSIN